MEPFKILCHFGTFADQSAQQSLWNLFLLCRPCVDTKKFLFQLHQCLVYHTFLKLTFPYRNYSPPHSGKKFEILFVTTNIAFYFLFPKVSVVFWPYKILTAFMCMPKTAIHKITVLYFGRTISGFPRSLASFFLYRKPFENRYFLTNSSGFVFLLRIRDILYLRCSGVCTSAMTCHSFAKRN